MTEISDDIKYGMIEAIAHLIHRDYEAIVEDFVTLDFIPQGVDLKPILPVLAKVFDQVSSPSTRPAGEFAAWPVNSRLRRLVQRVKAVRERKRQDENVLPVRGKPSLSNNAPMFAIMKNKFTDVCDELTLDFVDSAGAGGRRSEEHQLPGAGR
eukprot:65735-Prorocentrum_minimum.AAC.1